VPVTENDADAFGESILALSPEDADRVGACMAMLDETHPHEPCWYLNLLGVAAGHQGTGIGSGLLEVALARSDRDGIPAYLEATSPDNRRLYERHGFVVERRLDSYGGPPLWAMWRQPDTTRTEEP
jgi:GNAT superfamily N-acetyltransferase